MFRDQCKLSIVEEDEAGSIHRDWLATEKETDTSILSSSTITPSTYFH